MPEVHYFEDARGEQPVREYIERLARAGERSVIATFARYVDLLEERGAGVGMPIARLIDRRERIYELRPGDHRIAYAEQEGAIVLLHAWRKQSQRLDRRALATVRRRLDDWRETH